MARDLGESLKYIPLPRLGSRLKQTLVCAIPKPRLQDKVFLRVPILFEKAFLRDDYPFWKGLLKR